MSVLSDVAVSASAQLWRRVPVLSARSIPGDTDDQTGILRTHLTNKI